MRYLILALMLSITNFCFADEIYRVCLEKSTGKLIQMQSGQAPLGTLKDNAVENGYSKNAVIEKYISEEEWKVIKEEQIDKPARDKRQARIDNAIQKKEHIKAKLNLTNADIEALKEALYDGSANVEIRIP